jgi:hypothetical protein
LSTFFFPTLTDTFQLGLCLGNHDLNVCLTQIEDTLDVISYKDSYTRIQPILERLFFCAMYSRTAREVRRILTKYLKDFNLKVVPVNSLQFTDDGQPEEVILIDDEDHQSSKKGSKNKNGRVKGGKKAKLLATASQNAKSPTQIEDESSEEEEETELQNYNELLNDFIANKLEPNSVLNFEHLIKIEQAVFQDKCANFVELLMKSRYLFEQKDLRIVLLDRNDEANDDSSTPNSFSKEDVSFRRNCLLAHLKQLRSSLEGIDFLNEKEKNDCIEHSIRSFYSLRSFEEYGAGSFDSLAKSLVADDANEDIMNCVKIEQAILSKSKSLNDQNLSTDLIIQQLNECPLLEDISEFLGWTRNGYASTFGTLKEYLIELNRRNIIVGESQEPFSIQMLETEPNCLLKLTKNTSIEQLKSAIEVGDFVNASGHLISLISIQYKTISRAPHALLVNEIQSSLSAFLTKCSNSSEDSSEDSSDLGFYFEMLNTQKFSSSLNSEFLTFICELINRIPLNLHSQLLFKFIIDPLVASTNDRQIKAKLFQFVAIKSFMYYNRNVSYVGSDAKIVRFLKLGSYCSISEWSRLQLDSILNALSSSNMRNVFRAASIEPVQSKKAEVRFNFNYFLYD